MDHINYLRNRVREPDKKEDLDKYLVDHSANRLTAAYPTSGNPYKLDVIVKEKQRQVPGYFNMDLVNLKKEKNEDRNGYDIEFSYKVSYSKPIYLHVEYPIMVCNQLIDKRYVQRINISKSKINIEDYLVGYTEAYKYVRTEYLINKWYRKWNYVRIPYFDIHELPEINPHMLRLYTVLLILSKDDLKGLFNLRQIPGYKLADDVIEYIKLHKDTILTKPYSSTFNMVLYENNTIVDPSTLTIDDDLNVSSKVDLNICKTYRVSLNVVIDWNTLSNESVKELKIHPTLKNKVVKFLALDENGITKPYKGNIISIPKQEMASYISGTNTTHIESFLDDIIYDKS
jgi:hypothetical protein